METFIWALALSSHLGFEGDYNQIHPHVRFIEDGVIAGAYYNSEERVSFYGGYRFEPVDNIGIELGAVSGYPALGGVVPYGRVTYDFNNNMKVFATPGGEVRHGETNIGAVIGIEFQLK
jgi:hypothetical protein